MEEEKEKDKIGVYKKSSAFSKTPCFLKGSFLNFCKFLPTNVPLISTSNKTLCSLKDSIIIKTTCGKTDIFKKHETMRKLLGIHPMLGCVAKSHKVAKI